ncbi:MAG: TraR/DksA family transcriptional regulator [Verrucomicrobiota bacterium]
MNPPGLYPTAPPIPPRWSWHYHKLQSLRDRLLDSRDDQLGQVAGVEEPFSVDPADSASDETDHEAALGILARDQDMLLEVNAAIRRILEGSYGICEASGQPIPPDRLRAVPWTRYTREVEARLEQAAHSVPRPAGHQSPAEPGSEPPS